MEREGGESKAVVFRRMDPKARHPHQLALIRTIKAPLHPRPTNQTCCGWAQPQGGSPGPTGDSYALY